MKTIFVFGSNLAGRHGAGSALLARREYSAALGVGSGRTGDAYAIPTKDAALNVLPLEVIAEHVTRFKSYAAQRPYLQFNVVAIGCGLAGYKFEQVAPLFRLAAPNVRLPSGWRKINGEAE